MIRVLIVDDERLARVALRSLLQERSDVQIVGEADSVASARVQLEATKPDVVFLDVQMSGGSGFDLFKAEITAKVVFCTAYEQYAVRAFEVNALDYLVKPASPEAVERALKRIDTGLEREPSALTTQDMVALREARGMRFARVSDITYLQAADDYSEVHLADGSSALVNVTLRTWEARLPVSDFVRIHRSTLVNLGQVQQVLLDGGRWKVVLRSGVELTVSRRLASDLKERLRPVQT